MDAVLVLEDDEPGQSRVSGNLAIQVFGASANEVAELRESVAPISGSLDGQDSKAAVFTVPVTAGFAAIEELFKKSGVEWYYGNVYADRIG